MIAADTSSLRRYWAGQTGRDTAVVDDALHRGTLVVPPVVLTELLSDPAARAHRASFSDLRILELGPDFWLRAGLLRADLLERGYKAKLADTLIAQSCIDHEVPLITHDRDFRRFARHGLKLV